VVRQEPHRQDEGREASPGGGQPPAHHAAPKLPGGVGEPVARATEPEPWLPWASTPPHPSQSAAFGQTADRRAPSRTGAQATFARVQAEVWEWMKTVASAGVYAVFIVTFGFQVARVEGKSMEPTLEDQDRLIVNKLIYQFRSPHKGDVVMLYSPENPDKALVKRVIAEEGDLVRIVDGRVYVNETPIPDEYVASEFRSHDDWGPETIKDGYYFVMGDHRNNSSDSRQLGLVPRKYITGKVQIRWWPLPEARLFR
jgi:signal peptidase I